jgi:hypothetical protein
VHLATQTGTILMLTIAHTGRTRASITGLDVRNSDDGAVVFTAAVANTGNIHFSATGEIVVRRDDGRVIARLPFESGTGTILPDGVRNFTARWRGTAAPPGRYQAEARVRAPGLRAAGAQLPFALPIAADSDEGETTQSERAGREAG